MTPHSTDTRPHRAPDSEPADESHPERPRRRWPWVLLVVAGVLAYLVFRGAHKTAAGDGSAAAPAKGQAGARAVPVVAATARTGDLGVYLTGLGTVTPLNTVTVRSRVDGQLMNVSLQGRPARPRGRPARRDRSAPVPGPAHAGRGPAREGPGGARERAARPRSATRRSMAQDAIPQQQLDTQAATVAQIEAASEERPGPDRQREAEPRPTAASRRRSRARVGLRLVDAGNIVHATDANGLVVITQLAADHRRLHDPGGPAAAGRPEADARGRARSPSTPGTAT